MDNKTLKEHYAQLQGYTMVGLVEDGSPDVWGLYGAPLVGLKFKKLSTGEVLIVFPMSDAEGNAAGFLDIGKYEA